MYSEFADWWHLLSPPVGYAEKAELYWKIISKYKHNIKNALELGSGGGNNAFHLKKKCRFTLSDISPDMIKISQKINSECEHFVGDMREIYLNKVFDLVFIHDAIMLLTSEQDLEKVFQVAKKHLKQDGILFIVPDFFKETFIPNTDHGGNDDEFRSIRYLEWIHDINPNDNVVEAEYVYLMKNRDGETKCEYDKLIEGVFSKKTWEELLLKNGFKVTFELIEHPEIEANPEFVILGQ